MPCWPCKTSAAERFDVVAAVGAGAHDPVRRRGGLLGILFAVMQLQVLRSTFNLPGLCPFYQMTVTGLIIVAAVLPNRIVETRRGRA